MHFYIVEPDMHQVPTPVHYYGQFFNIAEFLEKHGGVYKGKMGNTEIIHMVGEYGEIDIVQGTAEAPVFEYEQGLSEAMRLRKEGTHGQVIVWKEGNQEMLHVNAMGVIRRSV